MRLALSSFLHNEEHCVEYMLKNTLPFVDGAYILIDDRTGDKTEEICLDYGCEVKHFKFENFGKLRNMSMAWLKETSDWHLLLGGDEILDLSSGPLLRDIISKAGNTGVDCIGHVRVEWDNLEMFGEPLWRKKLAAVRLQKSNIYPKVHAKRYFHANPIGCKKRINSEDLIIHHFRMYWMDVLNKSVEDKQNFYKHLKELQKKDGGKNIWP